MPKISAQGVENGERSATRRKHWQCDIYVLKLRNISSQAVSDAIRTIHSLQYASAIRASRSTEPDGT